MAAHPLVVIDCETTGLGDQDRIVEVAAVHLDSQSWEIIDEYDTLINPECDTGPVHIHSVTNEMVEAAPVFSEIVAALSERLHGAVLIAHNFPFDSRMLQQEFDRLDINFHPGAGLCTMQASNGANLSNACNRHGVTLKNHHSALADARATAALARKTLKETSGYPSPAEVGAISYPLTTRTLPRGFS